MALGAPYPARPPLQNWTPLNQQPSAKTQLALKLLQEVGAQGHCLTGEKERTVNGKKSRNNQKGASEAAWRTAEGSLQP